MLASRRHALLFRRCWRLGFVTVCTAHSRRLLDRCVACGEPVTLHHLPKEMETITQCARCQHDLRAIEAPGLEDSPLSQRVVAFQAWLLAALATGWCQLSVPGLVRLAPYLRVLHQLARVLATHPRLSARPVLPPLRSAVLRTVLSRSSPPGD